MVTKKLIGSVAALILLAGCSSTGSATTVDLNVSEFSQKITNPDVIILDVRTPEEFASGHIEGAVNIDFNSGEFENEITRLNPSDSYAIYCRSGSRSGKAASIMHLAGFHDVSNLDGGVIDWSNDGLPLVVN
jgi:rhodanese-related sulfurtransferase